MANSNAIGKVKVDFYDGESLEATDDATTPTTTHLGVLSFFSLD